MARDNRRNYYRILHVQPDAPLEVIKSSYRTLMQRLRMHPDLGGDHWNATLINEAYEVLTDPDRRAEYDRRLPEYQREAEEARQNEPSPERAGPRAAKGRPSATGTGCPFCYAACDQRIEADSRCQSCGSPLARAGRFAGEADWGRAVERVPKDMPLLFCTEWPQAVPHAGVVQDLSLTGVRFSSSVGVPAGGFLKLETELFQAVARVVHSQIEAGSFPPRWQLGAEFYTLHFSRSRGGFVSTEA